MLAHLHSDMRLNASPPSHQPDQFIDEGEVGVSGAADQEEELGDAADGVNGATSGGGVSLCFWLGYGSEEDGVTSENSGWQCRA